MGKLSVGKKKILYFVGCLFLLIVFGKYFFYKEATYEKILPIAEHPNGHQFVGSDACRSCHVDIYNMHINTAHFNTSSTNPTKIPSASNDSISFNKGVYMNVAYRDSLYYQNVYSSKNDSLLDTKTMDITIGSGVRGHSYLHWEESSLYQLQISFSSESKAWINSPGFSRDSIRNPRAIIPRCMECHTTFTKVNYTNTKSYSYDKNQIIYGIDCERCHGPGFNHVKYHNTFPDSTLSKYIIRYSKLNRKQRLDGCALCHSGIRSRSIIPATYYLTGNDLRNYSFPEPVQSVSKLDVHGNQFGLLSKSKCFIKSDTMDCTTCHDPHKNQRNNSTYFINKCLQCHTSDKDCSLSKEERLSQKNETCISCHMPLQDSKSMLLEEGGVTSKKFVKLRSHYISIYKNHDKDKENINSFIETLH